MFLLVEPGIRIKGKEEVKCGDIAEFKAEVTTAENFCMPIIWQRHRGKSVEIIDTTLQKYSGSTNTKLVISSVCKEDAFEYQASLSRESNGNKYTVSSNIIRLSVLGDMPFLNDLKVTTEEESVTIHYNFRVLENSPQVQDMQWRKNDQTLNMKDVKFIGGGLNDSCLVISSPSGNDKGNYSCTVTNAVGSVTKDIDLEKEAAPSNSRKDCPCVDISIKPGPTVHFASNTKITAIVMSTPQPEKAQWQKSKDGNVFLALDVKRSKYFGSNSSPGCPCLVIPKTTFNDIGYYRLQISNKLGVNVSNIVYLKVTGSLPNITISHETDINNRTIKFNGGVFLTEDSPDIHDVFWSKNGEKIDIQGSGGRLSGGNINNPSLTIRGVSQEDVGKYHLTAVNAIGQNDSDVITIGDPCVNIVSERYEKEDTCNEYICFLVIITSVPSPCYAQWYVKSKGEEICLPLDVNAEEYQGSTNSLPRPKLVLIDKNYLKRNIYQIIVTNFVGSTVKDISEIPEQSKVPLLPSLDKSRLLTLVH
uniref:Ig-like domain-containing protein n=1 Tax=Magallana gigas TaxID=29159 RepID=A0A8W8NTZ8_MAGGI